MDCLEILLLRVVYHPHVHIGRRAGGIDPGGLGVRGHGVAEFAGLMITDAEVEAGLVVVRLQLAGVQVGPNGIGQPGQLVIRPGQCKGVVEVEFRGASDFVNLVNMRVLLAEYNN